MVSPTIGGLTVVFDRDSDQQYGELATLSRKLSRQLNCLTLAIEIHGDSVFYYRLFEDGRTLDKYDSCPSYFGGSGPDHPSGGNAELLCKAFRVSKTSDRVHRVLHYNKFAEEDSSNWKYGDETERHRDLAKALKLPMFSVGFGYDILASGTDRPKGLHKKDLCVIENEEP
jgi:hypothetical protein